MAVQGSCSAWVKESWIKSVNKSGWVTTWVMGQYTRDPLTHDPLTDAIKFHEQFQWLSVFDL